MLISAFGKRKAKVTSKQKKRVQKRKPNQHSCGEAAMIRVKKLRHTTRERFEKNRARDEEGFQVVQAVLSQLTLTRPRQFVPSLAFHLAVRLKHVAVPQPVP